MLATTLASLGVTRGPVLMGVGEGEVRGMAPRPLAFSFDASGVSNRLITPNGDGLNDAAVLSFSNPRDSSVRGRIYDLRGSFVSDMTAGPTPSLTLQWDGKGSGGAVASGIYVYVLEAEEKVFTGTLVVVR